MGRSLKTLRLRGGRTNGRGRSDKAGNGKRGGTGNAGHLTHKICKTILEKRKALRNRKCTNFRDLESRLESLIKKKYIIKTNDVVADQPHLKTYRLTDKFTKKYKKILSEGELSIRLKFDKHQIKLSKRARDKLI